MSRLSKKLKEFDLDAPFLGREQRQAFRLKTRFLTSNIERQFHPFSNKEGAWKVLVEVVPAVTKCQPRNLLGVIATQVPGDVEGYLASQRGEREGQALEWLCAGVRNVFSKYGWPSGDFDIAVQRVIDVGYQNVIVWKKAVFNPSKSALVDIIIELNDEEARIVAVFGVPGGDFVQTSTLCTKLPSEFAFVPCLGKLKWLDDDTVELTSKSGSDSWVVSRL